MSNVESELKNKLKIVFQNNYFWKIIAIIFALIFHYDLQKINYNIDSVNNNIWNVEVKIDQLDSRVDGVRQGVYDLLNEVGHLND